MDEIRLSLDTDRAVVTMRREPGNAINGALVTELRETFRLIRDNQDIRGVVLSGSNKAFSIGLDYGELLGYQAPEFERFWWNYSTLIEEFIAFPKPLIAAVTGQCIGGGCIIALCADYRIMAEGDYVIGLDDVAAGMVVPESFAALMSHNIGWRGANQLILNAEMLHPHRAIEVGIVDETCPMDEIMERAHSKLNQWFGCDEQSWRKTKYNLRQPLCEVFAQDFRKLYGETLRHWWSPEARAFLEQTGAVK